VCAPHITQTIAYGLTPLLIIHVPQALWSNLVARMQLLLDECLLPPASTAILCQELADTLAAQAATSVDRSLAGSPAAAPAAATAAAATAAASRQPALLLQCAEGLLSHSIALVEALLAMEESGSGMKYRGMGFSSGEQQQHSATELEAWLQQLQAALVEVRYSVGKTYTTRAHRAVEPLLFENCPEAPRCHGAKLPAIYTSRPELAPSADPSAHV
jgi:hypothetical protein